MFTGLVEEIGEIGSVETIDGGVRFKILAQTVLSDLQIGDSLCVSGACLTAVAVSKTHFAVEAVGETLEKTSLGTLGSGSRVNLERALAASGRFGGHIVQGHVNATGVICQWFQRGENWFLEVELPHSLMKYVILEGSISIEGISLTVAKLNSNRVGINIIPHTVVATNLGSKKVGETVNIEVDVLAKYVENILAHR